MVMQQNTQQKQFRFRYFPAASRGAEPPDALSTFDTTFTSIPDTNIRCSETY